MNVEMHLNEMSISITRCLESTKGQSVGWDQLMEIISITSNCAKALRLTKDRDVQFGRYLVFEHELFNIQLDVFSKSYVGSPHNHETWGVMSCISGDLGISDYIMTGADLTLVRKGILRSGAAVGFLKAHDWHSTETFSGDQVASFHVYGHEFNLDDGFRFNDRTGVQKYRRGTLHRYQGNEGILELES